jgi:DNA-binding transcriptional LysR family regulator
MHKINIGTLKYFLAVCEERHFTKAAKVCGVSQPTLSVAIQRLEHRLGGVLFERQADGVILTQLGRDLRPIFRAIVRQADRAVSKSPRHNGVPRRQAYRASTALSLSSYR